MLAEPPIIIRSDFRPAEEWVCLATRRASRTRWRTVAQRAGIYVEYPHTPLGSRAQLLDDLRATLSHPTMRQFGGCLLIPINLSVGLDSLEPVADLPEYVPMFPRRMPTCGTATEAMERMRITRAKDKRFARKFAGYRFVPVRIDDAIMVPR